MNIKSFILLVVVMLMTQPLNFGKVKGIQGVGGTKAPVGITTPSIIPCIDLQFIDFSYIPGAPTKVISAAVVTDAFSGEDSCQLTTLTSPQVKSTTITLPINTWQGIWYQGGAGSYAGYLRFIGIAISDSIQFLLGLISYGQNNGGHEGKYAEDTTWAINNPALRDDWAARSEVLMLLAVREIHNRFYGYTPGLEIWSSCSGGGRQGDVLAQRYPQYFDGYQICAPAHYQAALPSMHHAWLYQKSHYANGSLIMGLSKVPTLKAAVMAECDGHDGVVDNLIIDPRNCSFDPISIACPVGVDDDTCLNPDQVAMARAFYDGVKTAGGVRLYPGWATYGSETFWGFYAMLPNSLLSASDSGYPVVWDYAMGYYRGLAFDVPRPDFQITEVNFTEAFFHTLDEMARVYTGAVTDLSGFVARGAKMIRTHGWSDLVVPPHGHISYFVKAQKVTDGLNETNMLLYMDPALGHCEGINGGIDNAPQNFNMLDPLISWCVNGTHPGVIIARTDATATQQRTLPLCPYPQYQHYLGSTDDEDKYDAAFWTCVSPDHYHRNDDIVDWEGGYPKKWTEARWEEGDKGPRYRLVSMP